MDSEAPDVGNDAELEVHPTSDQFSRKIQLILNAFLSGQTEILDLIKFIEETQPGEEDHKIATKRRLRETINADLPDDQVEYIINLREKIERGPRDPQARLNTIKEILDSAPADLGPTLVHSIAIGPRPPITGTLLLPGLLVSLVGNFEIAIGNLAKVCYRQKPDTLRNSQREFLWRDICDLDSISGIQDMLIDELVDQLLHDSIDSAVQTLTKTFKSPPVAAFQSDKLKECIQRRHCVVHNGGRVSALYIKNLRSTPLREGEELPIDAEYLRNAADEIYFAFFSLAWALAFSIEGNNEIKSRLEEVFSNSSFFALQEQRYNFLKRASEAPFSKFSPHPHFNFQINVWLAHKFSGELDKVIDQINDFQVSHLQGIYKLAKLALLDKDQEAAQLAKQLLDNGELRRHHLLTWPLLRTVTPHISGFLESPISFSPTTSNAPDTSCPQPAAVAEDSVTVTDEEG